MIEKILSLEELKIKSLNHLNNDCISNKDLRKIYDDLDKIGFFSDETLDIIKSREHDKEIFTILRKNPDKNDNINGQDYIRVDYLNEEKAGWAKVYDFNLKVTSTCH